MIGCYLLANNIGAFRLIRNIFEFYNGNRQVEASYYVAMLFRLSCEFFSRSAIRLNVIPYPVVRLARLRYQHSGDTIPFISSIQLLSSC